MDFNQFEDDLVKHGLRSFQRIRQQRPHDSFYCFGFYTSGEFSYVSTTASSYEGLEEVALWYKSMEMYQNKELDELKKELKWSPADSPIHRDLCEILELLQPMMDHISGDLYDIEIVNDEWNEFVSYVSKVEFSFERALKRIDARDVFGVGDERKNVVVNLLMGDQSDQSRIDFAGRVNPPESIEMLINDLSNLYA